MKPLVLFFDCWYTLFTADLADDLERIADLLGRPYNRAFVKHFEATFMLSPGLDLRTPATRLQEAVGAPDDPAVAATIADILEIGFDRQRPYDDTLEELARLRQHYRLGLVTNSSEAGLTALRHRFELDERFDYITASYEVGAIKPDPAIFRIALDAAGVSADQAVMIGDNPADDIDGAAAVGLAAILLDRRGRFPQAKPRITELGQLDKALRSLKI